MSPQINDKERTKTRHRLNEGKTVELTRQDARREGTKKHMTLQSYQLGMTKVENTKHNSDNDSISLSSSSSTPLTICSS